MSALKRPLIFGGLAAAVIALVASASAAVGAIGPSSGPSSLHGRESHWGFGLLPSSSRPAPSLPGTVVSIALKGMCGPMTARGTSMMGQDAGMTNGCDMRLSADHATAPHGTESFLVTNSGRTNHEMIVLPLLNSGGVGARPIGGHARVDEGAASANQTRPVVHAPVRESCWAPQVR